jgi:hypothetical protein
MNVGVFPPLDTLNGSIMENQEGCFAMCMDTHQPCVLSIVPQCHTHRQSLTIDAKAMILILCLSRINNVDIVL